MACGDATQRQARHAPSASTVANASEATPSTEPVVEKFEAWLTALNAADRVQIARVNAGATRGAALLSARTLSISDRTGGFDREHLIWVETSATARVALVRARRNGLWRCLSFGVEAAPPHVIALLGLSPAEAPRDPSSRTQVFSPVLDDTARSEIIEALLSAMRAKYVYPGKVTNIELALRAQQAQGAYASLSSRVAFAQALTNDLDRIIHDRHVFVSVNCTANAAEPQTPTSTSEPPKPELFSPVFGKTTRLAGNIAYLEIASFGAPAEIAHTEIRDKMSANADAAALILDIRRNTGGEPATVALVSSYLFADKPVHLNSIYWRDSNTTQDSFTDPHVVGPKFGPHKPVFVLTSAGTFSAAEEFAYNLRALKRATIVGETTGGGAHPGGSEPLPYGMEVRVPSGRAINPVTKTNWERTGVVPDIATSADRALDTAHKLACIQTSATHSNCEVHATRKP